MSKPNPESYIGPIESADSVPARPPMTLQQRLAHVYDSPEVPGRPAVLSDGNGHVIPGTGGTVRTVTPREIRTFQEHAVAGLEISSMDRDWAAQKAEREARRDAAKVLKNKVNKGRKSA